VSVKNKTQTNHIRGFQNLFIDDRAAANVHTPPLGDIGTMVGAEVEDGTYGDDEVMANELDGNMAVVSPPQTAGEVPTRHADVVTANTETLDEMVAEDEAEAQLFEEAAAQDAAVSVEPPQTADLNATKWEQQNETARRSPRVKTAAPIPLDDLEAVAEYFEAACVAVASSSDVAISELRGLRPAQVPLIVREVLEAVMILFQEETDWRTARKVMARSFRKALVGFDKDQVQLETLDALMGYTWLADARFDPQAAFAELSTVAGVICQWVRGAYTYARALAAAGPKMLVLQEAARKRARQRVQRQTADLAATHTTQKLVYLNGGTDLITIEADGTAHAGKKRVLPGIGIGVPVVEKPRGADPEALKKMQLKKTRMKRPTPPKGGKPGQGTPSRTMRTIRTQPAVAAN
jgi:hypothetical protein